MALDLQHNVSVSNSMYPQEFLESFVEAWCDEKKRHGFNLKYSVSQTLGLLLPDLENLPSSSTTPSSSFHLLYNIVSAKCGSDLPEEDTPQLRDILCSIVRPMTPSRGSKLKESENLSEHGDRQTSEMQSVGGDIIYPNLSSPLSISNNNPINAASLNNIRPCGTSMPTDSVTIENMPVILPSDHQDTNLGFKVSAAEMIGALSNIPDSPTSKQHQALLYAVVLTSAIAFIISSTALILHKKRPAFAKKMQKAAFVFGAFGFMGILGMHLPASISWGFTLLTFLFCMLLFFVATCMDVMYHAK